MTKVTWLKKLNIIKLIRLIVLSDVNYLFMHACIYVLLLYVGIKFVYIYFSKYLYLFTQDL